MTPEQFFANIQDVSTLTRYRRYYRRFRWPIEAVVVLKGRFTSIGAPTRAEVFAWASANLSKRWNSLDPDSLTVTVFESQDDAALFKLMWS